MAMGINTNTNALKAVNSLERSNRSMETSMERLTSGKKINSAKDDAAGLAIATKMTSQINGFAKATQNTSDGMSLIQTMDGATDQVVSMMQRMRDLSVQSLNGTYTDENRTDINAEFQQLKTEIDRVGKTVNFNGQDLLNGTNATFLFQVGADGGANNKISVPTINIQQTALNINTDTIATAAEASTALANIDLDIKSLQTSKANWGAVQNRLTYTMDNLSTMSENLSSARSRIQDTDYAKESANLSRTQVLQQAGMSMLAQANQSSQNVLSLLR